MLFKDGKVKVPNVKFIYSSNRNFGGNSSPTGGPSGGTGGTFQIRQGQQKRLRFGLQCVAESGSLPLVLDSIVDVAVGCPCVRTSVVQSPLDSYQALQLNHLIG